MITFTPWPAAVQQIDKTRGDLYVAISEHGSFAVRIDSALEDADTARDRTVPGFIGLDNDGTPVLLRLASHPTYVGCEPLNPTVICPRCGGIMRPHDQMWLCDEDDICHTELK